VSWDATKQSPCTPPRQELSDGTKIATRGLTVWEISSSQRNKQTKQTQQTIYLNKAFFWTSVPLASLATLARFWRDDY